MRLVAISFKEGTAGRGIEWLAYLQRFLFSRGRFFLATGRIFVEKAEVAGLRQLCVIGVLPLLAGCVRFTSEPLNAAASLARFDARDLNSPALRAFIEDALQTEVREWPLPRWDFPSLTLAAFYFHPSLEVLRSQWRIANAATGTAAGLPNPVISFAPGFSANPPAGTSPWFPLATLDLPIETAGKRRQRELKATYLADVARLNVITAAWQVRSNLRLALDEWNALQRKAVLLDQERVIRDELVRLLEQRVTAGAASRYDSAAARTARLKAETAAAEVRAQLAAAKVRLADAIGIPMNALDSIDVDPAAALPLASSAELLTPDLRAHALQRRADILAGLSEYVAAEAALRLEIARQYPDIHLNPGYQFDQGEHKWSVGLSLELPVFNRNAGPIAEADARRREVAARFVALQASIIAKIDLAAASYRTLADQYEVAQNLVSLQHQQLETLRLSFQSGNADRLELSTAELENSTAELALADIEARKNAALGSLEDELQISFGVMSRTKMITQTGAIIRESR